jgi:hypothetical protein
MPLADRPSTWQEKRGADQSPDREGVVNDTPLTVAAQ